MEYTTKLLKLLNTIETALKTNYKVTESTRRHLYVKDKDSLQEFEITITPLDD